MARMAPDRSPRIRWMTTETLSKTPSPEEVAALAERFAGRPAQEIIAWAAKTYGSRLAISCSFGGTSGMVILDMALRSDPSVAVVYADTDYLFAETYETVRAV